MEKTMAAIFLSALIFLFNFSPAIASDIQTYIVHVRQLESTVLSQEDRDGYYRSFLPFSIQSTDEPERMVRSYHNVLSGFAARLTEEEVKNMQEKDGFVFAKPERSLKLQTTHTPDFLGLHVDMGYWKDSNFGKGVIIGVLDSGIFPGHPSFNDVGMPPPPAKWKGKCDLNVTGCNNKLIGARSFLTGDDSPVDNDGHGTHTSSTAAGAFVKNAEVLGNAYGTASGMAPLAHVAMYRVCLKDNCLESDILAGLDSAVADGVDVLSISLGAKTEPFFLDNMAIGAFGAIEKGIFVSCAAGNAGPSNSTMLNEAPWMLTVGASTMDRSIRATAKLGNNEEFDGESLLQPKDFLSTLMPLVDAGANSKPDSAFCGEDAFDGMDIKGKVVLCVRGGDIGRIDKGVNVLKAGGAGMILMNDEASGFTTNADPHALPASHVSFADGEKIKAYMISSSAPMAAFVFKGTIIGSSASPVVASFSSRGPSIASPGILKPDIIGPGVSILAAWPFSLDNSTSKSTFNIVSGTSMATPHLSGIAALIKSSHPDWSPAAIKSAMMTTADLQNLEGKQILDQQLKPADLFSTGAGHVNPSKANDPGLVYDIQPTDYIPYLCGLGYADNEVTVIAHQTVKCADISSISEGELNYPSFSVKFGDAQKFNRTLTNVGKAVSSYKVQTFAPKGVEVTVEPEQLSFSEENQKLTYTVSFVQIVDGSDLKVPYAQGFLKWVSASHSVRSPISITFE